MSDHELTEKSKLSDSILLSQKLIVKPIVIPESKATIKILPHDIDILPEGAFYQSKNGKASIEIGKGENNWLEITANCDSLILLVQEKETEIFHLQKQTREFSEKEKTQNIEIIREPSNIQWFQIWGFRFTVVLIIAVFIFRKVAFRVKHQI